MPNKKTICAGLTIESALYSSVL